VTNLFYETSVDLDLTVGETYVFKVQARNLVGNSVDSDTVSVEVPAPEATAPEAPVDLENDSMVTSDTLIKITWVAGADGGSPILGYTVFYD
jgi:hypothetical protein